MKYQSVKSMLSAAAEVIRSKTGSDEKIKGDDFPEAISQLGELPSMDTVRPAFLQSGDKVAIVALSSAGTQEYVTAGQTLFESWGLTVTLDYYVADPTADRLATAMSLIRALEDETVKAIITLRGGNGSQQVVDYVDEDTIRQHPKWIVGYSDVCGYLCEFIHAGVQCVHGPMCASIVNHPDDDGSLDKLHDLLFGVSGFNSHTFTDGNSQNMTGTVTGRLVGGNSGTILPYLTGKHNSFQFKDDLILLIEETEGMYTYEYYKRLKQYRYAANGRIKAVLVGNIPLSASSMLSGNKYTLTKEVFWDVPVAFTTKIGHDDVNYPLVLGSVATLDITGPSDSTIRFCETPVSVSYDMTNAEALWAQTIAAVGAPYKARIVPLGSNAITSVTVMMAGVDVTSTAWNASTGDITIASVTGNISVTVVAANAVPQGYTPVGYITCNGAQWFDAGFKGSPTLDFDVTAVSKVADLSNVAVFGGRTSSTSARYDFSIGYQSAYNVVNGSVFAGLGSGARYFPTSYPRGKVRGVKMWGKTTCYNDGELSAVADDSGRTFTGAYNVFVGCVNNKGSRTLYFVGDLYRMRFGSVADFIPVTRDSDGKAGMYDIIRNTFYPSSGSDFIAPGD